MGLNDERSYKCNYNVPSRELPRFVPPIRVRFVESEIDAALVQSVFDIEIEEDSGAYTLVGICEDMDMDMTEVEEMEERKGIGEGVEVCLCHCSTSGPEDGTYENLGSRCGCEGDGGIEGNEGDEG
ncbi:hypothetical protein EAE99_010668 [Botrytis elliptica]|nr:hypothetical protein EAE99_010668 [Botrytis elliptica]